MAATNPQRYSDLVHRFGWDIIPRLSALGIQNLATAQFLFVDSGAAEALDADDTIHGFSFETPLATIDYAVGLCTASEQSVILVAPGYAETKAAASALITADVAGIKIIGLGVGSLRPTLTLSTNTGAIAFNVTAANVLISNFKILVTKDAVASAIVVAAASCRLIDVEVADNASTTEAAIGILTTSAADDLRIERYVHNGFLAGNACTEAISLIGVDRCGIVDSWFRGAFSTAAIQMVTTACSGVVVKNCVFENGTTALTTTVVDNATSKWSAIDCFDVVGGYGFGGGSGNALASDDVSGVSGSIGTIANTGGTATIGGVLGDVANSSIATRLTTIAAELSGAAGIASFPAAAAAANAVSLAEVLRYLSEKQNGRLVSKAYADLTGYDTAAAFTVTGDVLVKIIGVVGAAAITSTSGTTTLSVGTTEAVAAILAASTVNNTQFAATDVWVDSTPADDVEIMASAAWHVVGGGAAINLVRSVDDLTAGALTLYCFWMPLSANGNVVAA